MSIIYHTCKANFIFNALSRLYIGSVAHFEQGKKDLEQKFYRLALLRFWIIDPSQGLEIVMNGAESSLVSKVKVKQAKYPIILELKANINKKKIMNFELRGDGVLTHQGRLCVPIEDGT